MRFRLLPKQDLYPDSPEANAGMLEGWEAEKLKGEGGFTLIEVIAALIIIAVMAAMIYPVTSGQWRTAQGVGECRELFELQGQMEEIVQRYKTRLADGGGAIDLEDFENTVSGYSYVDSGSTGFLVESGSDLTLSATPTSLFLVTLVQGDQRISSIFSE